jgi:hypothetical protein
MPRASKFPSLYDNVMIISMKWLREWKYIAPNSLKKGTISWSTGGKPTGSISILVDNQIDRPYVELKYMYEGSLICYNVLLVSVPSNIRTGVVWYFLCPHTSMRCRKLYFIEGKFLHRKALKGYIYKSQTYSKRGKKLSKLFAVLNAERVYEQLRSKYFKSTYAGKYTKRYSKVMCRLNESKHLSAVEVNQLLFPYKKTK